MYACVNDRVGGQLVGPMLSYLSLMTGHPTPTRPFPHLHAASRTFKSSAPSPRHRLRLTAANHAKSLRDGVRYLRVLSMREGTVPGRAWAPDELPGVPFHHHRQRPAALSPPTPPAFADSAWRCGTRADRPAGHCRPESFWVRESSFWARFQSRNLNIIYLSLLGEIKKTISDLITRPM